MKSQQPSEEIISNLSALTLYLLRFVSELHTGKYMELLPPAQPFFVFELTVRVY